MRRNVANEIFIGTVLVISIFLGGLVYFGEKRNPSVPVQSSTIPKVVSNDLHESETIPVKSVMDHEDWKTYRSDRYGFEFQYPKTMQVWEREGMQERVDLPIKFEALNISWKDESAGFMMHVYISNDQRLIDLPNESELPDKMIGSVQFQAFSQLGMGDRYGYMVKRQGFYYLLDTVFNEDQFEKILATFKFTK